MRTSGRHLRALINDILDLSWINARKLEIETIGWPQPFRAAAHAGDSGKSATTCEAVAGPVPNLPERQPCVDTNMTTAPPDVDSPLDPSVLDELRSLQFVTKDLVEEVTKFFVQDTGQRLVDLRAAVDHANAPTIMQLAHAIKGSAASLGARSMVAICASIETCAEVGDLGMMPARLAELQREFVRARNALAASWG